MSILSVTEVLCRVLEDPAFAQEFHADPSKIAKECDLSAEEVAAFRSDDAGGDAAIGTLPLRAFRMVSKELTTVPAPLQQRLNAALGVHASAGMSIPCTGNARLAY
jgi:hypothetical protein